VAAGRIGIFEDEPLLVIDVVRPVVRVEEVPPLLDTRRAGEGIFLGM
jgi:hypothetical protein